MNFAVCDILLCHKNRVDTHWIPCGEQVKTFGAEGVGEYIAPFFLVDPSIFSNFFVVVPLRAF